VHSWAITNGLKINPNKCQAIVLSKKGISVNNLPAVSIGSSKIPYSPDVTVLGFKLEQNLNWDSHINFVCASIYHTLSRLWACTRYFPVETRRKLVSSLILPKFLYGAQLYSGASRNCWHKLNRAFNSCVRYVYRKKKRDSIRLMTNNILGSSLNVYLQSFVSCFLFKIIKFQRPHYLYEILQFLSSDRTKCLMLPRAVSKIRIQSFFVHSVRIYNSLSITTRSVGSVDAFRERCVADLATGEKKGVG
jgi:hypothetical protein